MNDLISKKSLIKSIGYIGTPGGIWAKPFEAYKEAFKEFVKGMPSAEPKKGKWSCSDDMYETAICTACDWNSQEPFDYILKHFNFCPNCGAKMEATE